MKETVIKILFFMLFVIGACGYTAYADPVFLAELQSTQAQGETQSQSEPITKEDIDEYLPWIGYGLLVLFGLWVVVKIMSSEIAIPLFTLIVLIGVILFASYLFVYGDKDGDGTEDNQIIQVVQPSGGNPEVDSQYTRINRENTKSNLLSMAGISLYVFVLVIAFMAITGVGVVLHTLSQNKKDGFGK
jgi:hypothetical protein